MIFNENQYTNLLTKNNEEKAKSVALSPQISKRNRTIVSLLQIKSTNFEKNLNKL